jgi:crotonobetainyl-CoA:carnitine CoA-transferase CaiB-like acyl-CoA transferase
MAALLQRAQGDGQGQFVEVAMSDVAMILSSSHLTSYLWNGAHPEQKGNRYAFATIGCYAASDAPMMVSASNLRQQRRLWEALGRSDLVKHNNRDRIKGYAEEAQALSEIIATASVDHWETLLRACRVPVSRVQRMEAMLADEHVLSRPVLHRFKDDAGALAGLTVPVAGFQLSRSPVAVTTPPQVVGAQNHDLLSELGYCAVDIESMRAQGVIS